MQILINKSGQSVRLTKTERAKLEDALATIKALGPYDDDADCKMASEGLSGVLARISESGEWSGKTDTNSDGN